MVKRIVPALGLLVALAACQDNSRSARHLAPIPPATLQLMASKGMTQADPILVRAYKRESELEVWKRGADGRYALLKTYPICRWSGQLGPKRREGDRQAPEGFYSVGPGQMNPNSSYYLSFDTGYPNAYDRTHGGTGAHLMVHGSCSSSGCFAMTDEAIAEVYAIARESMAGGQRAFQFQSYPFRMTPKNLAQHRHDPHIAFWRQLKEGSDVFEATGQEPKVAVCSGRYVFGSDEGGCTPRVDPVVAQKRASDERQIAELVAAGAPAIRLAYRDGDQHASFRQGQGGSGEGSVVSASAPRNLGEVSRPEALASGPQEILLEANGKPRPDGAAPAGPARFSRPAVAASSPPAPQPARSQVAAAEPVAAASTASTAPARPEAKPPRSAAAAPSSTGGGGPTRQAAAPLPPASRAASPAAASRPISQRGTPSQNASPRDAAGQSPSPAPQASTSSAPERRAGLRTLPGAQPTLPDGASSGFTRLN